MPPKKRRKLQKRSTATKQRHATAKRKRQNTGVDARSAHLAKQGSKTRKDKIHDIEQSVGSLDRRINKAIEGGNLDQAKDLRSRQNKFTTKLGLERAIESGGVLRDSSGRIVRSSTTGQPVMTGAGHDIFRETKDMDFIDPTRRIQNVGGDAYGKMYPISNAMQRGLPALTNLVPGLGMVKNIAKSALSPFKKAATDLRTLAGDVTGRPFEGLGQGLSKLFDKRDIPYTDPMMPGERYPLDEIIKQETITEEEPFFGGRSKDPNYEQPYLSYPGYNEEVKITDLGEVGPDPYGILESQGIDPNFIYPDKGGEPGNTALQLAYQDEAEAALQKNLASHLDSEGRYTDKLPNPFFYDEQQKIKLREEAIKNQTPLTEAQIKTLEDKGVSRHFDHLYPDTPLTKQTLSDFVDRENTTWGQVGADLGADTLDTVGSLSGLNYFPPYDNMVNAAENYADSLDMTETSMEDINNNIAAAKAQLAEQYNWLNEDQINSLYDYNNQQSLF